MTIRLTEAELEEQYQEADEEELQFDPIDKLDTTLKFDGRFAQGWERKIDLREGIELEISQIQNRERVIISHPEIETHCIRCQFLLSGNAQSRLVSTSSEILWTWTAEKYWLNGTGSRDQLIDDIDIQPWSAIRFDIHEQVLRSFVSPSEEEMPRPLRHLVKPIDKEIYRCIRDIQPKMTTALKQILYCSYQGMVKRAYLESKVIELIALVFDHERTIRHGEVKKETLKPKQIQQIHYAREILLRDMYNPPSLAELARQVGLNDFLLKKGFRQIFGNTVFGELQTYRLELAKQLLAEGNLSAAEISRLAGYASPNSFSKAFRQKFGFTPTAYRKSC